MRLPRAFFLYLFFATISFSLLLSNLKIPQSRYHAWRSFFLYVISPVFYSSERFISENFNLPRNIINVVKSQAENKALRSQIIENELLFADFMELEEENEFLRSAANLEEKRRHNYILAEAVSRDANSWSFSVLINRGARDNLHDDMAVVGLKNGRLHLVGKVVSVHQNTSEVMLITNPDFAVPGLVPSTGCDGIVEHFGRNELALNHTNMMPAPIGDEVVVSPISRIFPPGILIGRIIDNRGIIRIVPEASRSPLRKVIIISKRER